MSSVGRIYCYFRLIIIKRYLFIIFIFFILLYKICGTHFSILFFSIAVFIVVSGFRSYKVTFPIVPIVRTTAYIHENLEMLVKTLIRQLIIIYITKTL